jgi:hypothetical protein
VISAGLMHLAARAALAAALAAAPDSGVAERECDLHWTRDGDGWGECVVALESWRCEVQGWCGDEYLHGPYGEPDAGLWARLPDPRRPGLSYVTKR